MIAVIRDMGERLFRPPDAGVVSRGHYVDDVDTALPAAAVARDPGSQEAAHDVAAWDVVHHVVADMATTRGVRALLRSTDGDFRITADRVDDKLALTIEARRDRPSVAAAVESEGPADRS